MLKFCYSILILVLLSNTSSFGQNIDSLNQNAEPIGGIQQLAIRYYGIEFSKEQRELLKNIDLEFIYLINEKGNGELKEINGIRDQAIQDSLKNRSIGIEFTPEIKNGMPISSIYFMKMQYPTYTKDSGLSFLNYPYNQRIPLKLSDFEYYEKSKSKFEMTVGGIVNHYFSLSDQHLGFGGGLKFDFSYTNKRQLMFGFTMSAFSNKRKKDFPIDATRKQLNTPTSLLLGGIFGKRYKNLSFQAELTSALTNISEQSSTHDPKFIQVHGMGLGLLSTYSFNIGKERLTYSLGTTSIQSNAIGLHVGIRYVSVSMKEASGFVGEFGVSYRFSGGRITNYKIKDEYFKRTAAQREG